MSTLASTVKPHQLPLLKVAACVKEMHDAAVLVVRPALLHLYCFVMYSDCSHDLVSNCLSSGLISICHLTSVDVNRKLLVFRRICTADIPTLFRSGSEEDKEELES